ncbi:hypothetical protein KL931_004656 [Ogataea haglerorum]|nr:hypothetical protein KL931_004656 [Ogataea haglerorum]
MLEPREAVRLLVQQVGNDAPHNCLAGEKGKRGRVAASKERRISGVVDDERQPGLESERKCFDDADAHEPLLGRVAHGFVDPGHVEHATACLCKQQVPAHKHSDVVMCRPDGKDDAPYNRNRAENHNHWPSLADDVGRPRHDHGAHYLHSITSCRVRVDVRDRIVLRLEPQVHVAVQLDGHNVEDERRGEQPDGLREKQRLHRVEGELLPRLPLDRVEVGYNQLFLVFFQPPRLGIVWSVRDRKVAIDGHRDRDNSVKNKQPLVRGEAVHTVHAAMQSALEVTREHVRERGRDLEIAGALAELRRGIPLAKKSNETAITRTFKKTSQELQCVHLFDTRLRFACCS